MRNFRHEKRKRCDCNLFTKIKVYGKGERIGNQVDLRKLCNAVDTVLTPRERQVIVARYGLGGGTPMRQREVSRHTGISRSYVSRIEKKALEKLRAALE